MANKVLGGVRVGSTVLVYAGVPSAQLLSLIKQQEEEVGEWAILFPFPLINQKVLLKYGTHSLLFCKQLVC